MTIPGRWWVGDNIGETGGQGTVFGNPSTFFIGKPNGYESLPSGDTTDDAQFAAAAKANAKYKNTPGSPSTISVENIQWFNIQGPFTTQAEADAAIPGIQKANPAPGVLGQIAANVPVVGSIVHPLGDIANFFEKLGEASTWERVGLVLAGVVLVYIGLKASMENTAVGKVAKDTKNKFKDAAIAAVAA
jgi:hypothetical protein